MRIPLARRSRSNAGERARERFVGRPEFGERTRETFDERSTAGAGVRETFDDRSMSGACARELFGARPTPRRGDAVPFSGLVELSADSFMRVERENVGQSSL